MKVTLIYICLLLLMFVSCNDTTYYKSYISCYVENVNGKTTAPDFSLIQIRNDSIFYQSLEYLNETQFLGLRGESNNFESNGIKFNFIDNDNLTIQNETRKIIFKSLISPMLNVDSAYFNDKKYVINSKFVNDTIRFFKNNTYRNFSKNSVYNWRIISINNFNFLWMQYQYDEVPLVIEKILDDGFRAKLYAKDEIEIDFREIPL